MMKTRWLACVLLYASLAVQSASATATRELAFDVLLDGEPIGSHRFTFEPTERGSRVDISADFEVRLLWVPVFQYRHSNTELWRDGCLAEIDSATDSNGRDYRVSGRAVDSRFVVETGQSSRTLEERCLMTFAYWDRRILQQERLMNAQTGELVEVEVRELGEMALPLTGDSRLVEGYRILSSSEEVDIKVYYDTAKGTWVALESVLPNGRVMRYRPSPQRQANHQASGNGES